MYAPIYYDANNTSYYTQPPNTGTSAVLAGNVGIGTGSPTSAGLVIATNVSGVA
ncbi:hypothetical protein M1534_01255 [Patescibacteria group bacterium]|nr:hypothetical protein [Patescibacteria group bacterium]